jgi:hypothetical protein
MMTSNPPTPKNPPRIAVMVLEENKRRISDKRGPVREKVICPVVGL